MSTCEHCTNLAQLVPAGQDEIRTVIEPYLLQLGLINITPRGREVTEMGKRKIAEQPLGPL